VAALAAPAFPHGGEYVQPMDPNQPGPPPPTGGGGGPGGPAVPPGTADPPSALTRWETWWAANKESFLRLNEAMREDDAPESRGLTGGPARGKVESAEQRAEREAAVREAIVPLLLEALGDPSFEVRTSAAIALGKAGRPEAAKALHEAAVKDRHKDVRDSALLGLGLLGRAGEIPFLDGVLNDHDAGTRHRSFAAFSLGLIGGEDAAAALLAFADGRPGRPATFTEEPPPLIASTFVAMGLTGDARVLPVLRRALADAKGYDENVRAFVVLSLGRMKDRESLPDIGRLLVVERDPGLRRSAAVALGRIATTADTAAVEGLLSALDGDKDEMVRHFAAISLGGMKDPEVAARVAKLFPGARASSRPFLALSLAIAEHAPAVPMLRAALAKETDESLKASYCIALALLRDHESAPLMENAVKDHGLVWLQGYAAVSLGMMGHVDSASLLNARLAAESDPRLRANLAVGLGLMHDPAAKAWLVKTLRSDGSVFERGGAAMAMGVLRMNEAVPDLAAVYKDKKEQDLVRAFSVVALGLIADPAPVPKLARFAIDNNYSLSVDPLNEVLSIY
jgi:HEAT repeat protein